MSNECSEISNPSTVTPQSRKRGGRLSGTTNVVKRQKSDKEKEATHNIVCRYLWEIEHNDLNKIFKKDIFENVLNDAREKFKLAQSFHLPYETVLSRIRRNNFSGTGLFLLLKNRLSHLLTRQFLFHNATIVDMKPAPRS